MTEPWRLSLVPSHQGRRRLSGPSGPSKTALAAHQQKENFVNSRTTALSQDVLQAHNVMSPAKKKANAKKSRVSFSTELEDVRFYKKGARVSDVLGEGPKEKAPSRSDALAKELAKKELKEASGMKRILEPDLEPVVVAEVEHKRSRMSDEFGRQVTNFFNSASFDLPSASDSKEAIQATERIATVPTPSVSSLLDELLPEPVQVPLPNEDASRRKSFTLASQAASPSPSERTANTASLSTVFEEIMAQQEEPVRASMTQQYTMAFNHLMNTLEEKGLTLENGGENVTSDLSGVVQRVMASYNNPPSNAPTDMEFTGVIPTPVLSQSEPDAALSLAAAFDALVQTPSKIQGPAPDQEPVTLNDTVHMEFTETFGGFALPPGAESAKQAESPAKSSSPRKIVAPAQEETTMQEEDMALTRAFDALPQPETAANLADDEDLDAMETTRTYSPQKSITMDFTRVVSPLRSFDEKSVPSPVASRDVTMELTRTLEPNGTALTEAMELTRTIDPAAPAADSFAMDFVQLLAQSQDPSATSERVPHTPISLAPVEEPEERENTQTFAHSFVALLDEARNVDLGETDVEPVSVPALTLAPAPAVALASLPRQVMPGVTALAQLLSECDLWRAFSAAPKTNQSLSLSFAALPPHATVSATKEDLLRVRFSTAAEVSALEQRASDLRASIAKLEAELEEAQNQLATEPSPLQMQWATLDEGQRLAAGHRVRRLWTLTRRGVQLERAEQRHSHELARRQRLAAATALARTSTTQGDRHRAQLASLEEAMRFDLAQLRQRQRQRQHVAPERPELAAPLALSPAQAHAREQDMFDILTGAVGWAPMRLAPGEIALRFGGDAADGATLSLQLAMNVHQRAPGVPIVQHLVAEASRDALWQAPLESLASMQLSNLQNPSELVAAFGALALRVGRVQRLERDIRVLRSRHAQVQVTPTEQSAEVAILFSSLQQRRRFWLRVQIDAEYPMSAVEWRIDTSIGGAALERQANARVNEILRSLHQDATRRFVWLPQLCAALEQWTRGEAF